MLVRAFEIQVGREAQRVRVRAVQLGPPSTVWNVEPESNHTSSVSRFFMYMSVGLRRAAS